MTGGRYNKAPEIKLPMEYYSAIKKTLLSATTWTDLQGIMLSKINQRETNTI